MKTKSIAIAWLVCAAISALLQISRAEPPAVPEEARKYFVMGTTLMNESRSADDAALAAGKFKQAAELAPQWLAARRCLADAREAAGDYAGAIADLKIYQQFKLPEDETRKIQDKIYVLEAKQEKAAKDKEQSAMNAAQQVRAAQEAAAEKTNPEDDFFKKLDGARYSYSCRDDDGSTNTSSIEIKGKTLIMMCNGFARHQWGEIGRCEIQGREFIRQLQYMREVYRISDTAITQTSENNDGSARSIHVHRRER